MAEWRITFGRRYAHEPHPTYPLANPDGYLTVIAPDELIARTEVIHRIGLWWCGIYAAPFDEARWHHYYPLGEIARFATKEEALT